jgi:hypothetical protein
MKKKLEIIMATIPMFALASCGVGGGSSTTASNGSSSSSGATLPGYSQVDTSTLKERDRYDNEFGEANLPNQWSDYGTGDPYVMRWNGEYYLFPSTKNFEYGYRCWKSRDLIHYEYLGEFPLTREDGTTTGLQTAYAPEVIYWNGDFYMYSSPDGQGHYIFKSVDRTPYGEYRAVTDNIGLSIDGDVFIDDDEKMYFMSAADGGINSFAMDSPTAIETSATQLYSPLVKWTEGPMMIKHDGVYFLTYTGNHVKSKGYRVDYSYSTTSPTDGFHHPSNNSLLISTTDEMNGLGHSSSVIGPNLDSYYIAYHNLDSASGPIRSFNINRLSFSGTRMNCLGPTYRGAMAPEMPSFEVLADGTSVGSASGTLSSSGNGLYSSQSTSSAFSAEYNFKNLSPDGSVHFVFSHGSASEGYATISDHNVILYLGGQEIGRGTLNNDFDWSVIHSLRLSYGAGRFNVYFDNLKKIDVASSVLAPAGQIGYVGLDASDIGTTVFSNDSFDSSDHREAKVVSGSFFASTYQEENTILSSGSGAKTLPADLNDDRYIYQEGQAVALTKAGDRLVYAIDVLSDGLYGIENTYARASAGSAITIQIDNGKPYKITLSDDDFSKNYGDYEADLLYLKNVLAEIPLTKGLHTLKFELVSGSYDTLYYNLYSSSAEIPSYSNDLSDYVTSGAQYMTLWKIDKTEQAHYSKAGSNNLVLFGKSGMTDYDVSVDIKVTIDSANDAAAGLYVRCLNASIMSGQINECATGYLVSFNDMQLTMKRTFYDYLTVASQSGNYALNVYHTLRVVCLGSRISVYFDGNYMFEYCDPDPVSHGQIGLYSIGAQSYYKNLIIKGVSQ